MVALNKKMLQFMNNEYHPHPTFRKNHGTTASIWIRWFRQEGWTVLALPAILIAWVVALVCG